MSWTIRSIAAANICLLLCLGFGCAQNYGDLRLIQRGRTSTSFSAGRLEIFINSTWGSVCADNFNKTDADVACRQLGYEGAVSTDTSFHTPYGRGLDGPVWLDEVNCSEDLLHLLSCANDGVGEHDCDHFSDVAVVCIDQLRPAVPQPMDVRLRDGAFPSEGRVEVYCSGQWEAVCNQLDFQQAEADAVCRELGYTEAVGFDADVSTTDLQVSQWQGQLSCENETGGIASCGECSDSDFSNIDDSLPGCSAVTVRCAHTVSYGSLRLVQGTEAVDADATNGRLEIFQNGEWGTVCSDTFTFKAANISCQELGFLRALRFQDSVDVGFGVGSDSDAQTGFECAEDDQRLIQCSMVSESDDFCTHNQDVAVFCTNAHPVTPPPGTEPPEERSTLPTTTLVGILVGCFLALLLFCVGLGVFSAHFCLVPYSVKKERHSLYFVEREREGSAEAETRFDTKLESNPMDSLGKNLGDDVMSRPRAMNRYVALDTSRPDMVVDSLAEPSAHDVFEIDSSVPQPAEFYAMPPAPKSPGLVSVHSLHVLPGTPLLNRHSHAASLSPDAKGSLNSIGSFSFATPYDPGTSQSDICSPVPTSIPIPPPLKRQMVKQASNDGESSHQMITDDDTARSLVNPMYKSDLALGPQDHQLSQPPLLEHSSSVQFVQHQETTNAYQAPTAQHGTPTRSIMKSPKSSAKNIRSMPHLEQRRDSKETDTVAWDGSSMDRRRVHDPSQSSEVATEDQQPHNHHVSFLLD